MKQSNTSKLPTVEQILSVAKERNIPLTPKKAKELLKRWKIDLERKDIPTSSIPGNMDIFSRYIQPGFIVANPGTKTAYSVPRVTKKGR
ncbi:hypothetical protein [Enterobacter hormaechei]|uniref:hypothetical protein n=1 Tax=Enterobacter hormaechei TaxID=158836 RepID=UPI00235F2BB9|nr:hypothetical protein [Enterobacter hormaechei]